ncbi:glucose-1-phosphate cytidylyltransferase [uncultured Brevundimonas sp.]|uniref:glucose-1-phosphate cytidylyltransferase n=1 Tax=uncultured Brevundimonas sp. TaxID=213418 RepID=UPI0030ED4CA2|tara:strand:- start:18167 stop:18949 length:783 start_codon:yes stop_codon:yes gene_type:complete
MTDRPIKAVILAGGKGTRIAEETVVRPKPMVEIGGRPILWHIMKSYSHYGVNDFVICCGYLGHRIKEYFLTYSHQNADITVDLANGQVSVHQSNAEPWRITLVDTGPETLTGGRIRRVADYVRDEPFFCMTYGDGVCDVDIGATIDFHRRHGKSATVTATTPLARFGALEMNGDAVTHFVEKPHNEGGYINGGYFVLNANVLDLIEGDETVFEKGPLEALASRGELMAFRHDGFWQPMDTLRDKQHLEELWAEGAPWKSW